MTELSEQKRPAINWMDVLWLLFLAGLAALPPVREIHKQLTLLAIGVVQFSEGWILTRTPRRGAAYIVLLKIALATLLIDHTGTGRSTFCLQLRLRNILVRGQRCFGPH
jgi:hypothetical protein